MVLRTQMKSVNTHSVLFRWNIMVPSLYNLNDNMLIVWCNLIYLSRNGATLIDSGLKPGDTNGVMPFAANSSNVLKSCFVTPGIFCSVGPKVEIRRSIDYQLWANNCCLCRHIAAKSRPNDWNNVKSASIALTGITKSAKACRTV